jgi:hypothetical protein
MIRVVRAIAGDDLDFRFSDGSSRPIVKFSDYLALVAAAGGLLGIGDIAFTAERSTSVAGALRTTTDEFRSWSTDG